MRKLSCSISSYLTIILSCCFFVHTLHLALDDDMLKIVSVPRAYLGSAGRALRYAFSTLISTKSIPS